MGGGGRRSLPTSSAGGISVPKSAASERRAASSSASAARGSGSPAPAAFRPRAGQRRLFPRLDKRARDTRHFACPCFILTGEGQVVTRGYTKREEIADLLTEIGPRDREAVFLSGKFGFTKRHPRFPPSPYVEPLIDRDGRLRSVEPRIGTCTCKVFDLDVEDGIEAESRLTQPPARGLNIGTSCGKSRRSRVSFLERLGKRQDGG